MANALVADRVDSTTPFSGANLLDDSYSLANAISSGNWIAGTISGVGTALDVTAAAMDPVGTLIAHGCGWVIDHLDPIKTWFDQLTGDADQVMAFSKTWTNVANRMYQSGELTAHRLTDLDRMSGETIDAYRAYLGDAAKHLHMTGDWATAMARGLEVASGIVGAVHGLVRDVLSQIVGAVISAVGEAIATVGLDAPKLVAQLTARVAALAERLATTIKDLIETFKNLKNLLGPLRELMERAHGLFDLLPPGKGSSVHMLAEATEAGRTPLTSVAFKLNPKHDATEFAAQLAAQEKGLNQLTVQEFLDNRDRYLVNGRDAAGSKAQQAMRQDAEANKIGELVGGGMDYDAAKEQAATWMKTQAALHDPDQIAGGFADRVTRMGDSGINSSIGSQWKTRISALDDHIRQYATTLTPEQRLTTKLNVQLTH